MGGCPACGEINPARARFCLACGQPLGGEPDHARAVIDDALEGVPEEEVPDNVGETFRTAADIERLLGNTAREREHLTKAEALFRAKGNVVRAREVAARLPDLGADG